MQVLVEEVTPGSVLALRALLCVCCRCMSESEARALGFGVGTGAGTAVCLMSVDEVRARLGLWGIRNNVRISRLFC